MNKLLKGLLLLAICTSSIQAATNKTTLIPRSHGVNLAMEYTTWNELLQLEKGDRFGANFQATVFYQDSSSDDDLGKYFGVAGKNSFEIGGFSRTNLTQRNVNSNHLIHDFANSGVEANNFHSNVKLSPEQSAWGVRIDYYQDLEKILKGLYLKVALPIVNVDNDTEFGVGTGSDETVRTTAINLRNFFNGTLAPIAAGTQNAQAALTKAKFGGSNSETSVADIDIALGYKFLDKANYHMSINLGFTIPTGSDPDGNDVFESIVGNANHWAFGAGLDFGAKLWNSGDQNIKLAIALNYRYLFESSEDRTLGLKDANGALIPWGQYYLVGERAKALNAQQLIPAANILTRNVDVTPGSQLDAILGLAYNNGGWSVDLGYNLFWKECEDVDFKGTWDDVKYAVANIAADMTSADLLNTAQDFTIAKANIDVAAAETPSYLTHKIYGGVGYIFKEWEYPLMLGLAAHYEFASDSGEQIENWGIWGKVGVAF